MTQNLDYDIKSDTNEVAVIGGTTTTWDLTSTYAPQTTSTSVFSDASSTGTYSYDPGNYYLPSGSGTATLTEGLDSDSTNLHYHLDNYYQWNAATAGSGGTITSQDATSSICPAGWRLPTSNSYTEEYSFGKLTNAYGLYFYFTYVNPSNNYDRYSGDSVRCVAE